MLALAEYAHDDGSKAFPKVETIGRKARMSRKGVQAALRRLEKDGGIVKTGQTKDGTNVYRIIGVEAGENLGEGGDNRGEDGVRRGEDASPRGVVTTPELGKDPGKDPSIVVVVQEAWGKVSPPLPKHQPPYWRKSKVQTSLKKAFEVYSPDEVAKAIANYAAVLLSPDHFWAHRWTLQEFLDRGLDRFVDTSDPLSNFVTAKNTDRQGRQQATPHYQLAQAETWIIETAWRLPLDEIEIAEMLGRRGVEGPDRTRLLDLWRQKRELAA